ncbi:DUF3693 domain-containing protein [Pseudaeromonas paramecii]|uniref:XRE family transcriptional regulator n=1 Tax=Pseudaeromonas paramecii TaxID=2138166 RepID=A0ABP8PTD8_9GAMM
MNSKDLITAYMTTKNLAQFKQMAAELGISAGYLAEINNGKKEFTDKTAIYIAIECGLDPQEVVMGLAEARAKSPEEKRVWAQLLKRYCAGAEAAACAGLGLFAALATTQFKFALCILC